LDCFEVINQRRSIRHYKSDPVNDADIMKILEAGRLAPSAGNLQPCYFIVVKDPQVKSQLHKAALGQDLIAQAPVVIVVCVDPERSSKFGDTGRNYYTRLDAANATQNMLLAACALGYGSCWVGAFKEAAVKESLALPDDFRVVSLIPLGKAAANPPLPPRRSLEEIVRWNKW
jgi:nitroreductase